MKPRAAFSVADLVGDSTLDTQVVAGGEGLRRPVLWAHVCEERDPVRWLGPRELLMTMGTCVPHGSAAQRAFIAALDDAGLAGMTLGTPVVSPRFTKALREEADRRGFPVLLTGPETPFAAIGQVVAAANADEQAAQVLKLGRLYRWTAAVDRSQRRSGEGLEEIFGTSICVVDDATGSVVIGPRELGEGATQTWHRRPLRTRRPTHLLVEDRSDLDAFPFAHLTQVVEFDTDAILLDAEDTARRRSSVLKAWLGARKSESTGRALDALWGSGDEDYLAAACSTTRAADVHVALALSGLPVLAVEDRGHLLVAGRDCDGLRLREVLEPLVDATGVSGARTSRHDVGLAVAEAAAALDSATPAAPWQVYAEEGLSLLPRSRSEARSLIDAVLGGLADHDERSGGLRSTLFAFLDHDLHWQRTADHLSIHRQTLVYRLRQVEARTGRSVRSTQGIAELWLARHAWRQFEDGDHDRRP